MRIPFLELANRITGFSIPVFGLSWEPPILDIDVAKGLLAYLEDRRVLFNPFELEVPEWGIESILDIRQRLTEDLEKLDRSSALAESIRVMRAGCRRFLDSLDLAHSEEETLERESRWAYRRAFEVGLMDLRALFGLHIAGIAVRYGIDVEEELVSLFPSQETSGHE